jgi:hypothetical protein
MSSAVIINAFNNMLGEFLSDLQSAFPQETYITNYISAFELLRKANPKQIVKGFMFYVSPYQTYIFDCDESFFLGFDSNNNHLGLDDNYINKGLRLKHLWTHPSTTQETKACIFAYMQNLLKLGKRMN